MQTFPGYTIRNQIYTSPQTLVYQGWREEDHAPVIIKSICSPQPTSNELERLTREYELVKRLYQRCIDQYQSSAIIAAYSLIDVGQTRAIAFEDIGGQSLAQWLSHKTLTLDEFFSIAIPVVEAIDVLHQANVLHKDINPANIVWNPSSDIVQLIDFGLASVLPSNTLRMATPGYCEGTVAYVSPEQTGRMNRDLDSRSDLYSLGVTLYELLTKSWPYPASADIPGVLHAHLALEATPLYEKNEEIPQPLNDIVMSLLAKHAEERYQTAHALLQDLKTCQKEWEEKRAITAFPLARRDVSHTLKLPQKLYGRDAAMAALKSSWLRVESGQKTLVLVEGVDGVGKTSLLKELQREIRPQYSTFLYCTQPTPSETSPGSLILRTFRPLLSRLLHLPEKELQGRVSELREALQENGGLFVQQWPELKLLLGTIPEPPELPGAEATTRYTNTLRSVIHLMQRWAGPLVVCIDQLHHAVPTSISLLKALWQAPELEPMMMVCAYDREVIEETTELGRWLTELSDNQEAKNQTTIALAPLSTQSIALWLSDALQQTQEESIELAELLKDKTMGLPQLLRECLTSLCEDGLMTLETENDKRAWKWDLHAVQSRQIETSVADARLARFDALPQALKLRLGQASIYNSYFTQDSLAELTKTVTSNLAPQLQALLNEGFLLPVSLKALEREDVLIGEPTQYYQFAHEKLRTYVYGLQPTTTQAERHWAIVELAQEKESATAAQLDIFAKAYHHQQGISCARHPQSRVQAAKVLVEAGKAARQSAADSEALRYFLAARQVLCSKQSVLCDEDGEADAWEHNQALLFSIYLHLTETHVSQGKSEEGKQMAEWTLAHAATLQQKKDILLAILMVFSLANQGQEALRFGIRELRATGYALPDEITPEGAMQALGKAQAAWAGLDLLSLAERPVLPLTEDSYQLFLLGFVTTLAMQIDPQLSNYCLGTLISRQIEHGHTHETAFNFIMYGMMLATMMGNVEAGYQFGKVGRTLVERSQVPRNIVTADMMFNTHLRHWKEPFTEARKALPEIYNQTLALGGSNGLSNIATHYYGLALWSSYQLSALAEEMARMNAQQVHIGSYFMLSSCQLMQQLVHNLQEAEIATPWELKGKWADVANVQNTASAIGDQMTLNVAGLYQAFAYYLWCQYDEAYETLEQMGPLAGFFYGSIHFAQLQLYDSLIRLAIYPGASSERQKALLEQVEANRETLSLWAGHAPENFLHKYKLVNAERAWATGDLSEAQKEFEQAIEQAQHNNDHLEEALGCERLGLLYLSQGKRRHARHYLEDACYSYLRWGARGKAHQLIKQYPAYLQPYRISTLHYDVKDTSRTPSPRDRSLEASHGELDLISVLKASQALSEDLMLDQLLETLMQILIENSGAGRGCLLLEGDGGWIVATHGEEAVTEVPSSVLNYVIRTKEEIVIEDAQHQEPYAEDPVVHADTIRSILCAPLLHKQQLRGICYLDNQLTSNVFTHERLATMQLLASQAAISLDNAQLYQKLEQYSQTLEEQVLERTEALAQMTLEAKLAKTEADTANRNKTAFLADMNHELRTPLNAIIGFTRIVQRRSATLLPEKQANNLSKVLQSASHLLSLIDAILDIARLEGGREELQLDTFDICELATSCQYTIQPLLKPGVRLSIHCPSSLEIHSDREKIRQILINLLGNAAKFTHEGEIILRVLEREEQVDIEVADTGIGIHKEALEQIFVEFQQASADTRAQYGGTGLGLSISRKLAQLLGGNLSVSSALGLGATFTLHLSPKSSTNPSREEPSAQDGRDTQSQERN